MTNFQIAVLGFFIFFLFLGIVLFAGFGGGKNKAIVGNIEIWGSVNRKIMDKLLSDLRLKDDSFKQVKYNEINPEKFDQTLVEALASGTGPDIFILPHTSILKHQNKIFLIPYDNYSIRDFKNKFIEEGELYLNNDGILAMPFIIDPLVMYWNRDILQKEGISKPPTSWDEFFSLSQKITKKDNNLNIITSLVSFGEFRNISYVKDIISMLIMQADNPITRRNVKNGVDILLSSNFNTSVMPAEVAINFFTQFSNPIKPIYTWNRALPNSKNSFIAGDLAIYFGFASDLVDIRNKNPNLNFDVTQVPQTEEGINTTFGKMDALAISKNSKNISSAFSTIGSLLSDTSLSSLAKMMNLPPVSRNLLAEKPINPYLDTFYRSALSSKAWLDPNPHETNIIFQEMIESITSGRSKIKESIQKASAEIELLLN